MDNMITVLVSRDGISIDEAKEKIEEFLIDTVRSERYCGDLEEDFQEEFGLEPDYLLEILYL